MKTLQRNRVFESKRVLFLLVLVPLCMACSQKPGEGTVPEGNVGTDPMEGVWELTSQFWVQDGDTLFVDPGSIPARHKIYLDGFVILTSDPSVDSVEWHGYGTYRLTGETLVEAPVTQSLPMKAEFGSQGEVLYRVAFADGSCRLATDRLNRRRGTTNMLVEEWKKMSP